MCGQQHTVCRAVDKKSSTQKKAFDYGKDDCSKDLTDTKGANAYSFGNGTLGQLGIGIEGSSRGRLLPTLIKGLYNLYPMGIVDIAAGGNFTVAVTVDGNVYSFGHSEYNQHATSGDHIDPSYFFIPRKLRIRWNQRDSDTLLDRKEEVVVREDVHIIKVSCGFNYTIGITKSGRIYSWGWNENGVLGHGYRHFTSDFKEIESFKRFDSGQVSTVSTGSKHVLAIASCQGNKWASTYRYLLNNTCYADVDISFGNLQAKSIKCHSAILAARSPYFYGYLKQARDECLKISNKDSSETMTANVLNLYLSSNHADDMTTRSLIEYMYLDRVNIPHHKKRSLLKLAKDLCMEGLSERIYNVEKVSEVNFTVEMNAAINDITFADVAFTMDPFYHHKDAALPHSYHDLQSPPVMYGHKAILSRIPYFKAIFNSEFKESSNSCFIPSGTEERKDRLISSINISGLISDGLDVKTFNMLVQYAYTGQIAPFNLQTSSPSCMISSIGGYNKTFKDHHESLEKDLRISGDDLMGLLVAANMMSFTKLVKHCERELSVHIADFPENAENLLAFAQAYNFKRLEEQCLQLLELQST